MQIGEIQETKVAPMREANNFLEKGIDESKIGMEKKEKKKRVLNIPSKSI